VRWERSAGGHRQIGWRMALYLGGR